MKVYRMNDLCSHSERNAYTWTDPKTGKTRTYPAKKAKNGLLPFSSTTIYKWIKQGKFPEPIQINGISVWKADDLQEWINTGEFEA